VSPNPDLTGNLEALKQLEKAALSLQVFKDYIARRAAHMQKDGSGSNSTTLSSVV
jgi:hypothetical protein